MAQESMQMPAGPDPLQWPAANRDQSESADISATDDNAEDDAGEGAESLDADSWDAGGEESFVPGESDTTSPPEEPLAVSPVAALLAGDRRRFLKALAEHDMSPGLRRAISNAVGSTLDAVAACDATVAAVADASDEAAACGICGALAARIVARALLREEGVLDPQAAELLLAAWQDAAREIASARGMEGLRLLPGLAVLLARRAAGRGEPATVVADAIRHVAARIAADPALGRGLGGSGSGRINDRPQRGTSGPPRRIVLRGPVEIALHAR